VFILGYSEFFTLTRERAGLFLSATKKILGSCTVHSSKKNLVSQVIKKEIIYEWTRVGTGTGEDSVPDPINIPGN